MISEKFLMGRGRERLSFEEQGAIEDSIIDIRTVSARKVLIESGSPVHYCMLLLEGFICRSVQDYEGNRQMVGVHVPGDFIDLDGFQLKCLDHDIVTIGPVKLAVYDHATLSSIIQRRPRLTEIFWLSTLLDAAIHREWIFRLGRLGGEARIAHFFCELHARLEMVGLTQDGHFMLPMTQADLGEATGLTSVHVNRVLRSLRERGLLSFTDKQAVILDKKGLAKLGNFEPHLLYRSDSGKDDAAVVRNGAL